MTPAEREAVRLLAKLVEITIDRQRAIVELLERLVAHSDTALSSTSALSKGLLCTTIVTIFLIVQSILFSRRLAALEKRP